MNQNKLIDAYKSAHNYVQDKQIAHDLNIPQQRISDFRKSRRYMTDEQAIFLAKNSGVDPEMALMWCHADRQENPNVKALWESMAKKFDGMGLSGKSMTYSALAAGIISFSEPIRQCALYVLC